MSEQAILGNCFRISAKSWSESMCTGHNKHLCLIRLYRELNVHHNLYFKYILSLILDLNKHLCLTVLIICALNNIHLLVLSFLQ